MFNDKNEKNELDINETVTSEETAEELEIQENAEATEDTTEETAVAETAEETVREEKETVEEAAPVKAKKISKKARYNLTLSSIAVLFIAAIIIINLLCGAIATRVNLAIDLTPDKILKLSDETLNILDNLEKRVTIYSLIPEGENDTLEAIENTLTRYRQESGKISYVRVDTVANPQFLNKYVKDGQQINEFSIIVECDSKFKIVDINNVVMMNQNTGEVEYLAAEQRITSAIMHVTTDASAKIGVVQGHREIDFESFDTVVMDAENYDVVNVNLLTDGIAEDIDLVIIASPEADFHAEEIEVLDSYLDKGGNVQVVLDGTLEDKPVLGAYLAEWGVSVYSDAYVYEENPANFMNYPTNIIAQVIPSDMVESFRYNLAAILYPAASGLKIDDVHGVERLDVLTSSDSSYAKMDISTRADVKDEKDIDGPIPLTVILKKDNVDSEATLMVMGGTGFFSPFGTSSFGNADFYYNMLSLLTDGGETIYIRPKDISPALLAIPAMNALILSAIVVVLIPLSVLIAGFIIWRKRRRL